MTPALGAALAEGRERLAAAGLALADLEARVLLAHAAGLDAAQLLARGREPLAEGPRRAYRRLLEGRAGRAPVAYLTGTREFWSLALAVDPRVLIPRPETETLVAAALARAAGAGRVADVGTGSGAVALALAHELPGAEVWATDRSPGALEVARANARALGLAERVRFACGDLLEPLAAAGPFDAVVSNPPYVPTAEIDGLEPEVRDHEPRLALDGGPDGLRIVARLLAAAPGALRRGGWLLVEVGAGQAAAVRDLAAGQGAWDRVETERDLAGVERVLALQAG